MANPFELLKAKVSATNDVLKRKKVGVTIYIKKDAFALLRGNGNLVKRPCLIGYSVAIVGFKEAEWAEAVGA